MKKVIAYTILANICWTANVYAAENKGILSIIIPVLASRAKTPKGVFVDSGVENTFYATSSGETGRTDADGGYSYNKNDVIEFYIGKKKLGSTDVGAITSVFDFEYPDQVALLLQSIDSNGNPGDGIQISESDYQKISEAPFQVSELDGSSISSQEKIASAVGYSTEIDNFEAREHALQELKQAILERYAENLIPYLYEQIELDTDVLSANNNKIYGLSPDAYLKTPESRVRLYFFANYITSFISNERELYQYAIEQREITHDKAKERSEKFVDLFTKTIGLVALSKSSIDDIGKLLNAKRNIPFSGVSGALDPRQLNLFDNQFKQEVLFEVGKDHIKTIAKDYIDKGIDFLPFPGDGEVVQRMLKDCLVLSTPTAKDGIQCLSRGVGEIGMAMQDFVKSCMDYKNIRKINSATIAIDYLVFYYLFDRKSEVLDTIFNGLAEGDYTFSNFDEFNDADLEKALDYIAKKRFKIATLAGVQLSYNFDFAKLLIEKYKKIIEDLTDNFTESFDKELLSSLEPDHLQVSISIEPTASDDQYKVCMEMKNKYTPLKNVNGSISYALDDESFDSDSIQINLFRGHADSHTFCSSSFNWELNASMLNRSVLQVSYDFNYDVAFRNISKTQSGSKYFELSKKSVVDDLAKPIIKIEPVKFVDPGEEVIFDTSDTISAVTGDSFSFTWEYLQDDGLPNITFLPRNLDEPLEFTAPDLPEDKKFWLLRFKVRAVSNTSGEKREKLITLVVRSSAQDISTVTSATGRVWMDRNLGASRVATSMTDTEAYGDLYQWGRKKDGHEKRTSGTTTTLSSTDVPGHNKFILAPSAPNDWRNTQNNNLWQGIDGINNPCHSGFRVPTADEWQQEIDSWNSQDDDGAYGSPLKLVMAGGRSFADGSISNTYGLYWTTMSDGTRTVIGTGFAELYKYPGSSIHADGYSVRCILDEEPLQCGGPQQEAGGDTPETNSYNMGKNSGSFQFDYETYSIKDRIIIKHDNLQIFDTGCVGESSTVTINFAGSSPVISVEVIPNCDGSSGTDWNYTVHCPN
uniref:hypothetical protein n=1 Tax=Candidatus Electronema sp. TaxID=2698783 RepID=UPI0040574B69